MAQDVIGDDKSYRLTLVETEGVMSSTYRVLVIAADYCTIEPSGAATFWIRSPDGMRSALVMAVSRDEWKRIELAS